MRGEALEQIHARSPTDEVRRRAAESSACRQHKHWLQGVKIRTALLMNSFTGEHTLVAGMHNEEEPFLWRYL